MNSLINKRNVFIVVGIMVFIFLLGGSYALWKYVSTANADINTITHGLDYYINYTKGQDITSGVLNQSFDYTGGNSTDIELWKKDNTYDIYGHIYLDVEEIGSNLRKASSLKYVVLSGENIISNGSLRGINQGKKVLLKGDIPLMTSKQVFTVYIWLDITEETDESVSGETLDISVVCDATMMELGLPNYDGTRDIIVDKIRDMYNNATKTVVTNNGVRYNYATSVNLMEDADGNIRYYGANPNNYIYFNCSDYSNQSSATCEVWRIIGVFGDNLKIMRSGSIGSYSWDNKDDTSGSEGSYGKNDWSDARIMKLLNPGYTTQSIGGSLYYNSKSGNCYANGANAYTSCNFTNSGLKNETTRALIEEMTWNLGAHSSTVVYPNQIYQYERGTNVYSGRPTTWNGKVTLPYASDYAYAADLRSCNSQLSSYSNSNCTSTNWMKSVFGSQRLIWLLTTSSANSHYVWYVEPTGNLNVNSAFGVPEIFPTAYLDFSSSVLSGTGTSTNPYMLNV